MGQGQAPGAEQQEELALREPGCAPLTRHSLASLGPSPGAAQAAAARKRRLEESEAGGEQNPEPGLACGTSGSLTAFQGISARSEPQGAQAHSGCQPGPGVLLTHAGGSGAPSLGGSLGEAEVEADACLRYTAGAAALGACEAEADADAEADMGQPVVRLLQRSGKGGARLREDGPAEGAHALSSAILPGVPRSPTVADSNALHSAAGLFYRDPSVRKNVANQLMELAKAYSTNHRVSSTCS